MNVKFINETEVSRITGRAVPTLRNDRHKGQGLPFYKLGRSVRYRLDEILAFMGERRVQPSNSFTRSRNHD
jgi:predicted DNA-binding transcriptional regulator AlpA